MLLKYIFMAARLKLILTLFFCISFLVRPIPSKLFANEQIRESVIAGTWYPSDLDRLRNQLNGFFRQVENRPVNGQLLGLIVPHAGYVYSGQIAAHAYKLLEAHKFKTVVIIAPSHHARFNGVSVYDKGGYRTPLGMVALDHELIATIKEIDPTIRYVAKAHEKEHSLEIQLPFLQVTAPGLKLVPLIMGEQTLPACRRLSKTLAESVRGKPVLIVASTDLSHYHSYQKAKSLDNKVIRHVRKLDVQGLHRDLSRGTCEACGGGPMLVAMMATGHLGANHSEVLSALNSGDITGDHSRVVGYLSAAFWNRFPNKHNAQNKGEIEKTGSLTFDEKALLHQIVRQSVKAHLSNRTISLPDELPAVLKEKRGAFVTLRKNKKLRGCIGHIVGYHPLAETVSRMAVAAASQDPRFPPVRAKELPELEYEISVMSPLTPAEDINTIKVGTHGIYIRQGQRSGLLLPQVATEQGWDRMTFIEQTCRKASLPQNAWKDPRTQIFIFSAEVF